MELILALLLLLSPFLNFSGLHPISSPARSSRPTSINSFINAVRIDSVRERGRLGARQQSESSGCTATKVRQESERGRPQNPFQSPEQISFPFSGLSVLPSSLPPSPRHSLSHPLWNAARTLLRALSTGWHLPIYFVLVIGPDSRVCGWVAPQSFGVGHLASNCNFAPSSLAAPSGPSLLARR